MESVPTGRLEVVKTATPPFSPTVPREAVPFLKVTVPAGVMPALALTVAVNFTAAPKVEGFSDEVRVVVVAGGTTFTIVFAALALPVPVRATVGLVPPLVVMSRDAV